MMHVFVEIPLRVGHTRSVMYISIHPFVNLTDLLFTPSIKISESLIHLFSLTTLIYYFLTHLSTLFVWCLLTL